MQAVSLIKTAAGLRCFLQSARSNAEPSTAHSPVMGGCRQIGLVPTMGALHPGHLRLIQQARQENQTVVVSIFVNPLQFSAGEDIDRYPRSLAQDCDLCQAAGVDAIFAPDPQEWLSEQPMTQVIPPPAMTKHMCGSSRPGHFQGVATIVLKLLNLVQPDRAYFGQKDAQQLAIVQQLVQDLDLPVEVVPCPIVREDSGLAYSSRNQYLTPLEKQQATVLYRSLQQATQAFATGTVDRSSLLTIVYTTLAQETAVQPDYLDLVDPKTLKPLEQVTGVGLLAIAAYIGKARLIDNILLDARKPILAVDGPAGAGKSTVTRLCAAQLGLTYLDTGAMYRALTWFVLQADVSIDDPVAIADLLSQCQIQLQSNSDPPLPPRVIVNQQDVTQAIRTPEVTAQVSAIAAQAAVRQALVKQQQAYGQFGGIAAEGRDIGTHVFPQAGLKIFLTASNQERARRRQQDLQAQGTDPISLAQLEQEIAQRDQKDSQRAIAPLCKAHDAVELNTDGLSIDEVTETIVRLYRQRFNPTPPSDMLQIDSGK